MKKILIILIIFNSAAVSGQQDPFLSGDDLGPIWHNPASFGTANLFSVNAIGQMVWPDLPGHSSTVFINSEYKFGYKKDEGDNEVPFLMSGAGINLMIDQLPSSDRTQVTANYNLQIKTSDESRLCFGISPGIQHMRFDTTNWVPPTNVPDPGLPNAVAQAKFTMGVGVLYYWQNNWQTGYVGISTTHLTGAVFEKLNYSEARHYFINAGYYFPLTRGLSLLPTAVFATDGAVSAFSTLISFLVKPGILAGAGYGISGQIKTTIGYRAKNFQVQYVMGFQPSNPLPGNQLSHEIRFSFRKKYMNLFPVIGTPAF